MYHVTNGNASQMTQEEKQNSTDMASLEYKADVDRRLQTLSSKVEAMEKTLQTVEEIQNTSVSAKQKVAFYAQLTDDLTGVSDYQKMVFDLVTTNHGNGYSKSSGIFTATIPGTYVFSWTTANKDNSHMQTQLVVNNRVKGRTWSDSYDHRDFTIASNTVVVDLNQGDLVWIQSDDFHSSFLTGQHMSTFSGWLLFY